jgi:predicted mannosyl-3-phosphoglycerate phosphatase (HAD superfamily)
MGRRPASERLRALEQERQALEARIARARAQAGSVERQRLSRQRFVLGAALLPLLAEESADGEALRRLVSQRASSPADRRLLGLEDGEDDDPPVAMMDDD